MAGAGEKSHFSNLTLAVGEKLQGLGGTAIGKMFIGSTSPAYQRLRWKALKDVNPDEYDWAEVSGDPKAGRFPRGWSSAAILGADRSVRNGTGSSVRQHDAVAFVADRIVRVGFNPEDAYLFGGTNLGGEEILTVAMRRGTGPLIAGLVMYEPGSDNFHMPAPTGVIESDISVDSLSARHPLYPHTQLAG